MNHLVQGSGSSDVRFFLGRCSLNIDKHTKESSWFTLAVQRKDMNPNDVFTLIDHELACLEKGVVFWWSAVG